MKMKKLIGVVLASAMVAATLVGPGTDVAKADKIINVNEAVTGVYVYNSAKGAAAVSISTPKWTTKLRSGLTWEQLERGMSARLNVSDSACGAAALSALNGQAAAIGGSVLSVLDMDFQIYRDKGWSTDVKRALDPLRIAITLPANADLSKDYAIISIRDDGSLEVLGDIDATPNTITVDTEYFDTYAIVSGAKNAFDKYKKVCPNALDEVTVGNYARKLSSTALVKRSTKNIYGAGIVTDLETLKMACGGSVTPTLTVEDSVPGDAALAAFQNALRQIDAKRVTYYDVNLINGYGKNVGKTNCKVRVALSVPYSYPAYADYAIAVVNNDGSVSVMKDIDANDSTITIDTDQFRTFGILWGKKGAFDAIPAALAAK